MASENIWTYRSDVYGGDQTLDLIGFDVEATDGKIGLVEEESTMADDSYVVVDIGFWVFDKKIVLPAARSPGSTLRSARSTSDAPRRRSRTPRSST
ncbi:hypothetical protein ACFQX6_02550 [Streptosporangium lutulentum]